MLENGSWNLVEILLRIAGGGALCSSALAAGKFLGLYAGDWWGVLLPLLGGIHLILVATLALVLVFMLRQLAGG